VALEKQQEVVAVAHPDRAGAARAIVRPCWDRYRAVHLPDVLGWQAWPELTERKPRPRLYEGAMNASLILADGTTWSGTAFGARGSVAGEVVFNTGMVGYPECLTDPSYAGQILALTYPLVGNYGVPEQETTRLNRFFESERIQVAGLVVSEHSTRASHWNSRN